VVDDPTRFGSGEALASYLGLVPRRQQSGRMDRMGSISRCGDPLMRSYLFEAATVALSRVKRPNRPVAWARRLAERSGLGKARVALARKLATVLLAVWKSGEAFTWAAPDDAPVGRSPGDRVWLVAARMAPVAGPNTSGSYMAAPEFPRKAMMKRGNPNFEENHVPTKLHAEPQHNWEGRPLTPTREPTGLLRAGAKLPKRAYVTKSHPYDVLLRDSAPPAWRRVLAVTFLSRDSPASAGTRRHFPITLRALLGPVYKRQ